MPLLSILMYHMIREPGTPLEARFACPPARFASHLRALRQAGYEIVSLLRAHDYVSGQGALPHRAVAITLDDGYADNHEHAMPVLVGESAPATVFLTVNVLGGENTWMQTEGFPRRAMLTWAQIREMQEAGIEFGSHTLNHPRLSTLTREEARREVADAKAILEDRLGAAVPAFAYPYGDLNDETIEIVREAGHTLACSTRPGFNRPGEDSFLLRRIEVQGSDPPWKVLQKIRFGSNEAGLLDPFRYYLRRAADRLRAV